MKEYSTEVLVIGSGSAGLRSAIAAREKGCKVLLLTKCTEGLATSTLISGGAFGSSGFGLGIDDYIQMTMEVGCGRNNPVLVKILSEEAPNRIWELRRKGLIFRERQNGVRADGKHPILGKQIISTLLKWARNLHIQIASFVTAIELLDDNGVIVGCLAITAKGVPIFIRANAVILCTGGASALFKFHDNPITNIGDGYGIAHRNGVEIQDMEFIQFYPLVIHAKHLPRMNALPSFAEKGQIVNDLGEDILSKYGLSSIERIATRGRDKLSIALCQEMMNGRCVYLDIREVPQEVWTDPFEQHMVHILEIKYQARERLLPIIPSAHFTIGGCVIDENCSTSKRGLFAAGEVACGVHGANRMGGNALTETLVFGKIAGEAAARYIFDCVSKSTKGLKKEKFAENCLGFEKGKHFPSKIIKMLQNIMWDCCGPVRNEEKLYIARDEIERLKQEGICCEKPENLAYSFSVLNSLECAEIIIESSIARKESLGAHFRFD